MSENHQKKAIIDCPRAYSDLFKYFDLSKTQSYSVYKVNQQQQHLIYNISYCFDWYKIPYILRGLYLYRPLWTDYVSTV